MKSAFATLVAGGMVLASVPALAQGKQDFTLVNRTGYVISEVYVAPSASDDWEEDVLGRDTLANGERVGIQFPKRQTGCKWDLKVVFDDEDEAEWTKFDLCTTSKIIIRYDRKKGETWAEYE